MPNWCYNFATFTCPSKDIYDKLLLSLQENKWFETFASLGLDEETYENGWEYCAAIKTWGTKWTPSDIEIVNTDEDKLTIEISCYTAWSPPTEVYNKMNKEFNIVTDGIYEESGSEFFGRCFYENGEEVNDTYDFPSNLEELNELRKIIGSDLDDFMTSTWEQLQEHWENEEEDEEDENDSDSDSDDNEDEDEGDVEIVEFESEDDYSYDD